MRSIKALGIMDFGIHVCCGARADGAVLTFTCPTNVITPKLPRTMAASDLPPLGTLGWQNPQITPDSPEVRTYCIDSSTAPGSLSGADRYPAPSSR